MIAVLGTIQRPIGIDVTFGDVITPKAERRQFSTILDDETKITVYAYTVETLIAEKLQTVLSRGDVNTRPRDFYDLYMLAERGGFDEELLREAVANTFRNRHSEAALTGWRKIVDAVGDSEAMRGHWERYRWGASYAKDIDFAATVQAVRQFFERLQV